MGMAVEENLDPEVRHTFPALRLEIFDRIRHTGSKVAIVPATSSGDYFSAVLNSWIDDRKLSKGSIVFKPRLAESKDMESTKVVSCRSRTYVCQLWV